MANYDPIAKLSPAPKFEQSSFPIQPRLTSHEVAELEFDPVIMDSQLLLRYGFIPLRDRQNRPILAISDREALVAVQKNLPEELAFAQIIIAPRMAICDRLAQVFKDQLSEDASTRVAIMESCRSWRSGGFIKLAWVACFFLCGLLMLLVKPSILFAALFAISAITLFISIVLKTMAGLTVYFTKEVHNKTKTETNLNPHISLLIPLYREPEMVSDLIARLDVLEYPRDLLEVLILLEENDAETQSAFKAHELPSWVQVLIVPDGTPRTKPRALNYGLNFCRGQIIGVLDAEDAPAFDQLHVVARHFANAPVDVGCMQGILDYYNPNQNWIARCFTIEYATWFRLILPGLSRLGFAIPLGGTTLYVRRHVLDQVGGWDAHNVTEDADLGFRLERYGYRTQMIPTVTEEEANCHVIPWVRQRSRWLKGYMTTYLVHMRAPLKLMRQLGPWKFIGFQMHFVTAVSQFVMGPFLWSFWLVLFGYAHPLEQYVGLLMIVILGSGFLAIELVNLILYMSATATRKHQNLLIWVPAMHIYVMMGSFAAYKALYEMIFKPFYWDKTTHGVSKEDASIIKDTIKFVS